MRLPANLPRGPPAFTKDPAQPDHFHIVLPELVPMSCPKNLPWEALKLMLGQFNVNLSCLDTLFSEVYAPALRAREVPPNERTLEQWRAFYMGQIIDDQFAQAGVAPNNSMELFGVEKEKVTFAQFLTTGRARLLLSDNRDYGAFLQSPVTPQPGEAVRAHLLALVEVEDAGVDFNLIVASPLLLSSADPTDDNDLADPLSFPWNATPLTRAKEFSEALQACEHALVHDGDDDRLLSNEEANSWIRANGAHSADEVRAAAALTVSRKDGALFCKVELRRLPADGSSLGPRSLFPFASVSAQRLPANDAAPGRFPTATLREVRAVLNTFPFVPSHDRVPLESLPKITVKSEEEDVFACGAAVLSFPNLGTSNNTWRHATEFYLELPGAACEDPSLRKAYSVVPQFSAIHYSIGPFYSHVADECDGLVVARLDMQIPHSSRGISLSPIDEPKWLFQLEEPARDAFRAHAELYASKRNTKNTLPLSENRSLVSGSYGAPNHDRSTCCAVLRGPCAFPPFPLLEPRACIDGFWGGEGGPRGMAFMAKC